ncbi:MAG: O-antigen ligase family protein [Candidatus Kerfeldbacteria bacterium]|nr:O-antigen ligase family protein [Candidatus Kerfeldbacteria bacterium]
MSRSSRFHLPKLSVIDIASFFGALFLILLPWQARIIIFPGMLGVEYSEYGTFSFFINDIILALFLLSSAMTIGEFRARGPRSVAYGLTLFLLIAILSINNSSLQSVSFFAVFSLAVRGIAIALACTYATLHKSWLMWGVIVSGLMQSSLALVQFFSQQIVALPGFGMVDHAPATIGSAVIQVGSERILRAYGTLGHPNMLGGLLVVSLLCALWMFVYTKTRNTRLYAGASLILISAGLCVSLSRQAWIGAIIASVIFLGYCFFNRVRNSLMLGAALCLLLVPIAFVSTHVDLVYTRLFASSALEQNSIEERKDFLDQTQTIIRDNGWLGIGIGETTHYIYTHDRKKIDAYSYQPIHNVTLLIWQEIGLYGVVAWYALLLAPCILFFKKNLHAPNPFILALLALFIISWFDHYLWSLPFGISLFWMVYGLSLTEASSSG